MSHTHEPLVTLLVMIITNIMSGGSWLSSPYHSSTSGAGEQSGVSTVMVVAATLERLYTPGGFSYLLVLDITYDNAETSSTESTWKIIVEDSIDDIVES
jgi:hypothetical protein